MMLTTLFWFLCQHHSPPNDVLLVLYDHVVLSRGYSLFCVLCRRHVSLVVVGYFFINSIIISINIIIILKPESKILPSWYFIF